MPVSFEGNYVLVRLKPGEVISAELARGLLHQAIALCGEHGFLRILITGEAPSHSLDESMLTALAKRVSLLPGLRLALCLTGHQVNPLSHHFIRVFGEEGAMVRYFDDRDAAMRWLGAL
jgi:hypothetical protein